MYGRDLHPHTWEPDTGSCGPQTDTENKGLRDAHIPPGFALIPGKLKREKHRCHLEEARVAAKSKHNRRDNKKAGWETGEKDQQPLPFIGVALGGCSCLSLIGLVEGQGA